MLFDDFIKERPPQRISPQTEYCYWNAWDCFSKHGGTLSKEGIKAYLISAGQSPISLNSYRTALNAFFRK